MRDLITAGIRTGVQVAVAAVVAWAAQFGLDVDGQALEIFLFSLTTGVVTIVLNWLQTKFPFLGQVLSLGLSRSNPSY